MVATRLATFATVVLAVLLAGQIGSSSAETPGKFSYGQWSDWQLDCSPRASDPNASCAAVRRRICREEGTDQGVSCEQCGGQCREEVAGRASPHYIYTAWSDWRSNCPECSPTAQPCKAERKRQCLDRPSGKPADCEFCGGACREEQQRTATCGPECKWTRIHAYSDESCTVERRADGIAGYWGPQTNSPWNAGCSESKWTDACVGFGSMYYKWEPCVRGCARPDRMAPATPKR
jgi:hypothetical protein